MIAPEPTAPPAPAAPKSAPALLCLWGYVAAVLVCGALLAPLLHTVAAFILQHQGGPAQAGHGSWGWLTAEIVKAPYGRYFTRGSQIAAVLLLWPLVRLAGFHRGLLPAFRPWRAGLGRWLLGFGLAAGLLLLMGWGFVQGGVYRVRPDAAWLNFAPPVTAALGAGILEELFFRGALLGLLLGSQRRGVAVFWCTALFAAVHFLRAPDGWTLAPQDRDWLSGFVVLGQVMRGFASADFLIAEFSTLFAVGWVLALARLRTGQLWLSIGLHSGWVFGLKYFSAVTKSAKALQAGEHLPWIGLNLKIGLVPLAVVLITGLLALWLAGRTPASR